MSSITKKHRISLNQSTRRTILRSRYGSRILRARRRIHKNGGKACSSDVVSAKIEALQSLIPTRNDGGDRRSEELFQETADYIVLLKNQVFVLQRLIEFYDGSGRERENAVSLS